MPPLFLHMAVARDASESVPARQLTEEEGAYLLGSSAPDIRVIARWDRERTHFFKLDTLEHQDSVANFFAAHPELAAPEDLNVSTIAFIAGYLTHLALDETWIEQIYRPYFGQLSALGDREQANMLDRLLQYELDLRRRRDHDARDHIRAELEHCSLALDVGFLDSGTLREWQQVAIDQTKHPLDWERFRALSRRHLRGWDMQSEAEWERFREQIPELLQHVIDHISTAEVDAFLEQGQNAAREAVRRYLGVAA